MVEPVPISRSLTEAERKTRYSVRLDELARSAASVEATSMSALADSFKTLSAEITAEIRRGYSVELAATNAAETLASVSARSGIATQEIWKDFADKLKRDLKTGGELGVLSVDEMLDALGEASLAGVGLAKPLAERAFLIATDFSADLIQAVTEDTIKMVNTQLRLISSGTISPGEAIKNIEGLIPTKGTRWDKMTRGPLRRATTIVRTEHGRIYSLAQQARGLDYAARGVELVKSWRHSGALNAHLGHPEMDGQDRKVEELFVNPITGAELMFPRDPSAGPEETIGCDCQMRLGSPEYRAVIREAV